MALQAAYFLRGRLLGTSLVPDDSHSQAYLCEVCGDAWARIVVEGASWAFEYSRCEAHPDPLRKRVSGSLLRTGYQIYANYLPPSARAMALEFLPPAVLQHEFLLSLHLAKEPT